MTCPKSWFTLTWPACLLATRRPEKNPRGVVFLHSPLIQLCLAKSTGWQTKQRSSVRAAATQRWRGWGRELVIRATQDRHVLVAKPQPELMSRRGMPPSTNEGATSITVSQAQSARVWAGLLEPILGVQFSGVGKWQPHSYSNQRRHSEPFKLSMGPACKPSYLVRETVLLNNGGLCFECMFHWRAVELFSPWISHFNSGFKLWLNSNPHCSPFRSGLVIGSIVLFCFKNARIVSAFLSRCCWNIYFFRLGLRFMFKFRKASWGRVLYHTLKQYIWVI